MSRLNCRLCWNSKCWQFPTGEAAKSESGTYVATRGFGHEEWLFNLEWVIDGRKYAHLQPVSHGRSKRIGHTLDLFLYTYHPAEGMLAVGHLNDVEVLSDEKANFALQEFQRHGWLEEMAQDLRALRVDPDPILSSVGVEMFNVAFGLNSFTLFDPMTPLPPGDPHRPPVTYYILTEAGSDGDFDPSRPSGSEAPTKTVLKSSRRPVGATRVDLQHTRLQNQLHRFLDERGHVVQYEKDYIDLRICSPEGDTFLELKTASTARACLREAIGQLLEYAHFLGRPSPKRLVVVGRARPNSAELSYLALLRERYDLPFEYWQFQVDGDKQALEVFPSGKAPF